MAVSDISIPLKYVYVQATTPVDKTKGKLWYNTTTNALYTSNGTNYVALDFDTSYIDKQQLEQNINILINSASASSTLNDYDEMFLDILTSAGGELSTIDTENTTASFDTDHYINSKFAQNIQVTGDNSDSDNFTMTFTAAKRCKLSEIKLQSGGGSSGKIQVTVAQGENTLYQGSGNMGGTGSILTINPTNHTIEAGSFTIRVVKIQGYSTIIRKTGVTVSGDVVSCSSETLNSLTGVGNSLVFTPAPEDLIIQTNADTITANPTHHQIYCHNSVAGTGSVTYDISFDGGTTWDTDQELNTKNASGHTGSSMIIKINLNGEGEGNTASVNDYALMLYY